MKVKDIMIKEVITLSPDTPVNEAAKKLSELEISGLPVVEPDGKLVGMFTEKGILRAILPTYVEKVGKFIYEENTKAIKNKLQELNNLKVRDLMRKEVVTINQEASLSEAARIMLTQNARRLLVVDEKNKVIGMVARCDLTKAFMKKD